MLQSIRELSKSWIFKTLMLLLVISFGVWGIGDMFRGNPQQREVARVGKVAIPVAALEYRFQTELPQARKAFGPDFTAAQAKKMGLLERILNAMMQESLFSQEAKRLGINVGDQVILDQLAAQPMFRDKDGKFNTQLWQQLLRQSGLTERGFLDREKQDLAQQIMLSPLASNLKTPQLIIDNLYRARGSKRLVEIVSLRNDSIKDIPTPSEDVLKAYYEEHADLFVAPEYRGMTVAELAGANLAKEVSVSDDDIKKAFEDRASELALPETRDLVHVILPSEAKAKELAQAAQASRNLNDTAKTKGLNPIAVNKVDEKTALPALANTVFSLEEGQVSDPVKSDLGWHVVQIKQVHISGKPAFEQVRDELKKTLLDERAGDLVAKMVNQLDDSLAGGKSLEEIADSYKLHLTRYASLDSSGTAPDGKKAQDIPAKDLVLRETFGLNAGETGQVLDDGKGNYYVVRLDQVTPSQTQPFPDVRAKAQAAWLAEQQTVKAAAEAEEIAKAMREGKPATSFASRPGVEVRLSKPLSLLGDTDKEIPLPALATLYGLKTGDVVTAKDVGKQLVLKLADIVPVDPKKPEGSRIKVVDDLEKQGTFDLMEQYSKNLTKVFPERINTETLNLMKSQGTD